MRSRWISGACVVALMAAGNAAVIASGGGGAGGDASKQQYKPGCGPKKNGGSNPSGTHTGPPGLVGGLTTGLPLLGSTSSSQTSTSPCPK